MLTFDIVQNVYGISLESSITVHFSLFLSGFSRQRFLI